MPAVTHEVQQSERAQCFVFFAGWKSLVRAVRVCSARLGGVGAGVACIGYLPDSLVKITEIDLRRVPGSCRHRSVLKGGERNSENRRSSSSQARKDKNRIK